ncbi:MAG: 23S rRNA (pseudouridine(1915)-N(3))-methyltransferase RlmH [Pyrinomonadaceae bacterium]
MKFHFIWIGKTKSKHWLALQNEYLKRLKYFVKLSVTELKDGKNTDTIEVEGNRILEKVNQSSLICALDISGMQLSSKEISDKIENWQNTGKKEITFIIGGANGLSSAVVKKADFRLSLSILTFTHDMARVILLEQLYRGYTILKGFPYQK